MLRIFDIFSPYGIFKFTMNLAGYNLTVHGGAPITFLPLFMPTTRFGTLNKSSPGSDSHLKNDRVELGVL